MRPEEHLEKSGEKATVKFQCSNFSKLWRKQSSVNMLRRVRTPKRGEEHTPIAPR